MIRFRLLIALLVGISMGVSSEVVQACASTYDGPQLARVEDGVTTAVGSVLPLVSGPSSGRVERCAVVLRASTTPAHSLAATEDVGLSTRGLTPEAGTRIRPEGIPENWRITGTDSSGGTRYYDPSDPGNSVRVMQGNPNSPYPNSQAPYVRWQQNGQALDVFGNKLSSAKDAAAHIPLGDFRFLSELFK